jgi:molybdopterin converting factor subunit 1
MDLEIRLFAMLRDAVGQDRVAVAVPAGVTAADLKGLLADAHPSLESFLPSCRLAASQRFVADDYRFERPEEVALIPPVSGG